MWIFIHAYAKHISTLMITFVRGVAHAKHILMSRHSAKSQMGVGGVTFFYKYIKIIARERAYYKKL